MKLCLLVCAIVAAGTITAVDAQHRSRAPMERWSAVLAQPDATIDPAEIQDLVEPDLADADPLMRRLTLEAIATRSALERFAAGADAVLASPLRDALRALRPRIAELLDDPAEGVRLAAVRTLAALGRGGTGRAPVLDGSTQQILADSLTSETSARVRAEIVDVTSRHATGDAPRHRQFLRTALQDPDASVVAAAARGAGTSAFGEAVPQLVALLRHDNREVRIAATQALRRFASPLTRTHRLAIAAAVSDDADPVSRRGAALLLRDLDEAGQ